MLKFIHSLTKGILCALLLAHGNSLAQSGYTVRTLTESDSLAQNHVYCIAQDSRSFLWVGTGQGLSRFDGKGITNFRVKDGLAENFITAAAATPEGSIYFGHYQGSISFFNGNGFSVYHKANADKVSVLIYEPANKTLWSFQQGGKIQWFIGKRSKLIEHELITGKVINTAISIPSGFLLGTSEGLLTVKLNAENSITTVTAHAALEFQNVTAVCQRKNGKGFWVGTESEGMYFLETADAEAQKVFEGHFEGQFFTDIDEDEFGDIWITSRDLGLQRLSLTKAGSLRELINFTDKGAVTSASRIFLDDEGGIWCGTQGEGLKMFAPQSIAFFDLNKLLNTGEIYSAIQISTNLYWVATEKGLVQAIYNTEEKQYEFSLHPDKKLQAIAPRYLKPDIAKERIWMASKDKGLYWFNITSGAIGTAEVLKDHLVTSIEQDNARNYWVSVQADGVMVIDKELKMLKHYNTTNGLLHNDIASVCADNDGNIWFASTAVGVFVLSNSGEWDYLTKDGQFPSYIVHDIKQAADGAMWLATGGEGIIRLNQKELRVFNDNDGLLSSYASKLIVDKNMAVWSLHRKGLSLLNSQFNNAIRTYGPRQGVKEISAENNVLFMDLSGDVWFAEGGVLAKFNSRIIDFNLYNRKPFLSDFQLFRVHENLTPFSGQDSTTDYIPATLLLPHNKNYITLHFVAVDLRGQSNLYYRYKLGGFDKDWSPASREETTTYTNLPPGKYTFSVSASDNPFVFPGAPLEYTFTILKPYWKMWWFYLVQIAFVFALFMIVKRFSESTITSTRNVRILRVMVFVLLFIIFEYFHEFMKPYTQGFDNGAPAVSVLINLVLAMFLLPMEELLKKLFFRDIKPPISKPDEPNHPINQTL